MKFNYKKNNENTLKKSQKKTEEPKILNGKGTQ